MLRVCQPRREPGQEPIWICRPWPGCVAMREHRQTDEPLASRLNIAGSGSAACCVLQCWLHPHAGLAAVLRDSQLLSLKTKNIPFLGCNCQTVELTSLERKEASAAPWKQGASRTPAPPAPSLALSFCAFSRVQKRKWASHKTREGPSCFGGGHRAIPISPLREGVAYSY
jgi:hypothetical protein